MNGKRFLILLVFLVICAQSIPASVAAHSPGPMVLEYDSDTDTLTVTVTHQVSSPDHYVASIQVWKNDVSIETRTYTSQESNTGMDDTFTIDAVDGDVLKATATCSISGSVTEQITVGSTDTTPTSPQGSPAQDAQLYIIIGAIFVVIVLAIAVYVLRK